MRKCMSCGKVYENNILCCSCNKSNLVYFDHNREKVKVVGKKVIKYKKRKKVKILKSPVSILIVLITVFLIIPIVFNFVFNLIILVILGDMSLLGYLKSFSQYTFQPVIVFYQDIFHKLFGLVGS